MNVPPPPDAEPADIAPVCAETALHLMQHGAESALVEILTRRIGLALGAERVEIALTANAVTIAVRIRGRSMTTVRRNEDRGINMAMVMEVQRLVLDVEAGTLDRATYRERLLSLAPPHHPKWLVALVIGLSCACFARLNHADLRGCGLVAVAASGAMIVRQRFHAWQFSPVVIFAVTAFAATSVTALGYTYQLSATPKEAMAASVLLLVPGYPLINAVSDMLKGYIITGISRSFIALLLSAATCTGILTAMTLWQVRGWLP